MQIYAWAAPPALSFVQRKPSESKTEKQKFLKTGASIAANVSADVPKAQKKPSRILSS